MPQTHGWTPKFQWGAPRDGSASNNITPDTPGMMLEWVYAPGTSHVARFAFLDARKNSFTRKFGRTDLPDTKQQGSFGRGASELRVIFKGENNVGEAAEYTYHFTNDAAGEAIFERMKASPHPYGEVLYPAVIMGKIPYDRISKL